MNIPEQYIRKIIHIDMDAFYASVEQRDNPELKGKPVAVGGSKNRGVVAAASYEARRFGVKSAMPSAIALRKCPDLIFVKPNFEKYKAVSETIRAVFFEYTNLVEPLSLDEAFLDVTENKKAMDTATKIAKKIRQQIFEKTQLTASAGISINKFLAKVASDINKPNGQKTIMPDQVIPFLEQLPIQKFFGVGAKTAEKMKRLGIFKGEDLKQWDKVLLNREFGKSGNHYYNIVRGIQESVVKPDRLRKSISVERTFSKDVKNPLEIEAILHELVDSLQNRINKTEAKGKTLTLKLKYFDFEQQTRSSSFAHYTNKKVDILNKAIGLLQGSPIQKPLRLMGIGISKLETDYAEEYVQLTLNF